MTYKEGLSLQVGDKFIHKTFTGVYTIKEIKVLPKTINLKCDDGYTYTHKDVCRLVN